MKRSELRQIIREEIQKLNEKKYKEADIKFVKSVALDQGHKITDKEAEKCIDVCKNDYEEIKKYFYE